MPVPRKAVQTDAWIVGLDIGGTFTDVMMVHSSTGRSVRFKTLTTPSDPSIGALQGLRGAIEQAGIRPHQIVAVLHATTLVSNALIERKGARTALVTTRGFKDSLDIGREKKFDIYDLMLDKPEPLVSRELRVEVDERLAADGSVDTPLTEQALGAVTRAIEKLRPDAVAVCLIHSYMNPLHERMVRDWLQTRFPAISVCISSDILPEIREYERATTACANAYIQPLLRGYLERFVGGMTSEGLTAPLFVMLSEGAIAGPELVQRMPIRVCESGPAAGAVTASVVARLRNESRVLSFDMGGTTAKTCVVHDGKPSISTEFEVARTYRFKKGSGLPLRMPVVDLIEIGAGGGSLVHVDALGLLKVGPESAAADPGPACYGRGGVQATVTDADLMLGYLGAGSFLGGRMPLDEAAARQAIERDVARPLKVDAAHAALGIHEIVNENMANASRVQAVERGHDPSGHVLVAFGGAGPVHAWGVAQKLGVTRIVVPPSPGVGSALGLLLAPRALQLARTYIGTLDVLEWSRVQAAYDEMRAEAVAALAQADVPAQQVKFAFSADLRYLGQRKELTVALPRTAFGARSAHAIGEAFESLYEGVYHRRHAGHPIEALCWRLVASGPATMSAPRALRRNPRSSAPKPTSRRPMLFHGWPRHRRCPVYSRYELPVGASVAGPAVIEEDEASTVVGPQGRATVDTFGNLVVELPREKRSA